MRIIAGLGNPGSQYENNRHNVGFMAVDAIAHRHNFSAWSKKFQALISSGIIAGEKVLLIKPQTFMNLSGQAIGEAMRFHKSQPADLTVLYDELDLAPGRVRIKTGGGHGGHNGIKSTDAHCGKEYRRVRIGIGHPGVKEMVTNHVLGDFAKSDREWLDPLLEAIADNADKLVSGDDAGFMNKASVAVQASSRSEAPPAKPSPTAARSRIRQARPSRPQVNIPETGPMAAMLKKLFGKD